MNWKKYGLAVVISYVAMMLLGYLLHGVALKATYATAPAGMLRSEADFNAHFHWLALGYFLFALAACWVYAYGVENKSWLGQGVRYGLALWAMGTLMPNFVGFAVQPWPRDIAVKGTLADLVIMLVAGLCIAGVYRGSAGIPRTSGATV
jgi:hypothetical protein